MESERTVSSFLTATNVKVIMSHITKFIPFWVYCACPDHHTSNPASKPISLMIKKGFVFFQIDKCSIATPKPSKWKHNENWSSVLSRATVTSWLFNSTFDSIHSLKIFHHLWTLVMIQPLTGAWIWITNCGFGNMGEKNHTLGDLPDLCAS